MLTVDENGRGHRAGQQLDCMYMHCTELSIFEHAEESQ